MIRVIFRTLIFGTIVLSGLFATVSAQESNLCSSESDYDYQTTLTGGYRLVFHTSNDLKHLTVYKGNQRIRRLNSVSCGLPNKNLGYVGADFQDYFVLVQSFGSGNPHYIELIRKSNGRNVISREACLIDSSEKFSLLLYSEACTPDRMDSFAVLNVKSGKKHYLRFPEFMFVDTAVLSRIKISSISKVRLTLKFEDFQGKVVSEKTFRY